MLKLILLAAFAWVAGGNSGLETVDRSLSLEPVRSENSLSQQSVRAIAQDSLGYIWIGTREGLNRFDGYGYTHYLHHDNDPASLADNNVLDLLITQSGDLLVLTTTGLHRYDRSGDRLTRIASNNETMFERARLYEDEEGNVWFLSGRNLFCLMPGDTKLRTLDISDLHADENEIRLSTGGDEAVLLRDRFTRNGWSVYVDDGEIHIGSEFGPVTLQDEWLQQLERKTENFDAHYPVRELAQYFYAAQIIEAAVDGLGNLWFKNHHSTFRYTPSAGYVERIQLESPDPLRRGIIKLYVDKFGGVWLGTLNGLFYYNAVQQPFQQLRHLDLQPGGLSNNLVSAIRPVLGDTLLVGTIGGGLNMMVEHEIVKVHRHDPDQPGSLPNDVIWSVTQADDDSFWIATDHGFSRFTPAEERFERFGVPEGSVYRGAGSTTYTALARDCDSDLWLGTYTRGVERMHVDPDELREYVWPSMTGNFEVLYIHTSTDCRVWFGTGSDGLYVYSEEEDLLQRAAPASGDLPSRIYQIREDDDGRLLLATNDGLVRFDPESGTSEGLFREWGIPSQTVYAVERDQAGNLWMSTNNGLIRYSGGTDRAVRISESSGLMAKEFIRNASWRSPDGRLYFGSMDGLIHYDPRTVYAEMAAVPVHLTGIRKTGSRGVEQIDPWSNPIPEFTHRDHSVSFSFLAMNYVSPAQNRYRYRLLPLETEWVDGMYAREATYLNIPPGEYRFEVQASAGEGNWSEAAFIDLKMVPPFWQTVWFYLLVAMLIGAVLYLAHKIRVRRLLHVERLRMNIASDLHDEVGGNLSSITLLTEIMKQKKELSGEQRTRLERVQKASAQTMEAMSDIVWAINPGNDRVEDLVLKMKEVAAQMLPEQEYSIEVDEDLEDQQIDLLLKRDLFLIFKEAVTNIAKHSGAGHVVVRLKKRGKELSLCIEDNGCGFEKNGDQAGIGLRSMQKRAEKLNGELRIESAPDLGTTVQFTGKIT